MFPFVGLKKDVFGGFHGRPPKPKTLNPKYPKYPKYTKYPLIPKPGHEVPEVDNGDSSAFQAGPAERGEGQV